MKPKVEGLMIDRMDQNQEIVNRYLNDPAFQTAAFKALVRKIYEDIRRGGGPPAAPRSAASGNPCALRSTEARRASVKSIIVVVRLLLLFVVAPRLVQPLAGCRRNGRERGPIGGDAKSGEAWKVMSPRP